MACATTRASRAFLPHHKGPVSTVLLHVMHSNPHLRAGIEAEVASPNPITRAPSFHPSHSSTEAAAASYAATLTELASSTSHRANKSPVNDHSEQTHLQSETAATSTKPEPGSQPGINSVQPHCVILHYKTGITEMIGNTGSQERVTSLASPS